MSKAFGPELTAMLMAGSVAYFVFWNFPFLHSIYLVFRAKNQMRKRFTFICTAGLLPYGLISFLLIVITIPAALFDVYIAPQLEDIGYLQHSMLLAILYFFRQNGVLIFTVVFPPVFACISFFITRRLAARWNRIAEALDG